MNSTVAAFGSLEKDGIVKGSALQLTHEGQVTAHPHGSLHLLRAWGSHSPVHQGARPPGDPHRQGAWTTLS